jgi:hypothetical protein
LPESIAKESDMKKSDALAAWAALPEGADPLTVMRPIPSRQEGRSFGCDGVRIDGSPAFVDAVLSRLKPLLAGENGRTRLSLSRNPANSDFKSNPNAAPDSEVCYIRLHERGHEARAVNAMCGRF